MQDPFQSPRNRVNIQNADSCFSGHIAGINEFQSPRNRVNIQNEDGGEQELDNAAVSIP